MEKLTESQKQEVLSQKVTTDLSVIFHTCRILEVSTKRGNFEASELSYVGSLYDILSKPLISAINKTLEPALEPELEPKLESTEKISKSDLNKTLMSIKKKLESVDKS